MAHLAKLIILWGLALVPSALWLKWPLPALITGSLALLAGFILINIRPVRPRFPGGRLRILAAGHALIVLAAHFLLLIVPAHLLWWIIAWPSWPWALASALTAALISGILLFNGYLRLTATSFSLGIGLRLALILLWWLPPINLVILIMAAKRSRRELRLEQARQQMDEQRKESGLCRTRYPLLLVHGIFFRDWQLANYWGRIPAALHSNGATIYYGKQQSAATVALSGQQLARRIEEVLALTGSDKLNIIAHSKGGLDARWALANCAVADKVASLTTIATPHQGCAFVDRWLRILPDALINGLAKRYNRIFKVLGDEQPDFRGGVGDLTQAACTQHSLVVPQGIFCQSVAGRMQNLFSAPFPLNLAHLLIHDGANDGLVTVDSSRFGAAFTLVEPSGRKGISHADLIDLSRTDLPGFDVREFYISLVHDLQQRGY